jgi:hypothetical protein
MVSLNNYHGKFFGPAQVFMGYTFIVLGLTCCIYSLTTLLLILPGAFLAFTVTGTIIDFENKKVRPYTNLFGIFRTGKWVEVSRFSGFKIMKSTRRYTSFSRGSVQLDMDISDISLLIINKNGTEKVVLNIYKKFEDAKKDMEELKISLMHLNNI